MTTDLPPRRGLLAEGVLQTDDDGEVDFVATNEHLNEMLNEGWQLVAVDHGIAYWYFDEESLLDAAIGAQETCGLCRHESGNLCEKFGFSVDVHSVPHEEDCFESRS